MQWLVRKGEVSKDLLVEAVLAQQQLLDPPEKGAGLRSLDDPVVVRGREGGDFADRELREGLGCHRRELSGISDGAGRDDETLPRQEARDRRGRAEGARVCERDRRALEIGQ